VYGAGEQLFVTFCNDKLRHELVGILVSTLNLTV